MKFTSKDDISDWCDYNFIENYTISDDLIVDVDGSVILYMVPMKKLPVVFGHVTGDMILGENGLITLKGVPHTVDGDFICGGNDIEDLDFFPVEIYGRIILLNNRLKSFISPLEKAKYIIEITQRIPGLTYLDYEDNYYKYDVDLYLEWNRHIKNFYEDEHRFII